VTEDESQVPGPPRSIYLGPWRIDITDRHGTGPLPASRALLARAIARTLDAAGAPAPGSVGLILSDDAELAQLNASHMGHDGPTDVLSFPLLPPEAYPPHPRRPAAPASTASRASDGAPAFALPAGLRTHIGDIVVSVERAIDQAAQGRGGQTGSTRWQPADELRLLVTHGTLHLCGWDHADPVEGDAMRALERELLAEEPSSRWSTSTT
jgi:probable rRNA maturation factor